MIALIAAVFGFGGFLETSAKIAQTVCFAFLALCTVSLLLSLFEAETSPLPVTSTLRMSFDPFAIRSRTQSRDSKWVDPWRICQVGVQRQLKLSSDDI